MRNIKLTIEYDGTNYCGWQRQNDKLTIEGKIEELLSKILKEDTELICAGRTDAGVHAMGQIANFNTIVDIKEAEIVKALNSVLPNDIVIKDAEEVDANFHARKSSKIKHYRYVVNNATTPSALSCNREYYFKYFLDKEVMELAIKDLVGKYDFKGFMNTDGSTNDTVRTIIDARITKVGEIYIFDFIGNGFLYNMVRIIIGTILDIGTGRSDICVIKNILNTGERNLAGKTLPPQGLFLVDIKY